MSLSAQVLYLRKSHLSDNLIIDHSGEFLLTISWCNMGCYFVQKFFGLYFIYKTITHSILLQWKRHYVTIFNLNYIIAYLVLSSKLETSFFRYIGY